MHPALWPVHSCRTLEFCPRIARLSTELRCPPVYILATNPGCIQCNFLHCLSRRIPLWVCHSACWKRGSQGPGKAKMQQTGPPWRKLSTVGLPEEAVQAGPGRPWQIGPVPLLHPGGRMHVGVVVAHRHVALAHAAAHVDVHFSAQGQSSTLGNPGLCLALSNFGVALLLI